MNSCEISQAIDILELIPSEVECVHICEICEAIGTFQLGPLYYKIV